VRLHATVPGQQPLDPRFGVSHPRQGEEVDESAGAGEGERGE
jgi:hypothetical protein